MDNAPSSAPLRVLDRLMRFLEEDIPAIMLGVSVLALCADVFARYVLNSPIVGAQEIALIGFIWMVYLAASGAARRQRHIVIDIVAIRLSPRWQAILDIIVQLLTLAILAYVLYNGWRMFANGFFVTLPGSGISKRFLQLAIPVSATFMAVYALRDLWVAGRGAVTGEFSRPEAEESAEVEHAEAIADEVAEQFERKAAQ